MSVHAQLGLLWAKSPTNAQGTMSLLTQHLFDTAAVAELVWDEVVPFPLQRTVDGAAAGGDGRALFRALCALHDIGKATPGFQAKDAALGDAVQRSGLSFKGAKPRGFRHEQACQAILQRAGLPAPLSDGWRWLLPLIAGHHGVIRDRALADSEIDLGPDRAWREVQAELVRMVLTELGAELAALDPPGRPPLAHQLAVAGWLSACDWIASSLPGHHDAATVGIALARARAAGRWPELELTRGWTGRQLSTAADVIEHRFGRAARPSQALVMDAARADDLPGLLIVEAPMGEGKTEAALAAVELLAARTGADGIFIAMPTQATSDAMLARVQPWADAFVDAGTPIALLHGKRRFSSAWRRLPPGGVHVSGIDDYGMDDGYCSSDDADDLAPLPPTVAASQWLLGAKRGLLCPLVVGTVDHLLLAATSTKYVAMRMAGLVGKVVVVDEVHAYDAYMGSFLHEALRWLGDAGVPVVLLSATLPPATRLHLIAAYRQGLGRPLPDECPTAAGYPVVTAVGRTPGSATVATVSSSWRPSQPVVIDVPGGEPAADPELVARLLPGELADGGCALVIVNTVERAQLIYTALRDVFGGRLHLLHARLTASVRVARTDGVLAELAAAGRREPTIVVATQVAEQSFDIDADVLVSDLAPIDLLLQRIGRLHRHERGQRPARLVLPRARVIGHQGRGDELVLDSGGVRVYGEPLLRRAAGLVAGAQPAGWSIPADVPRLVAAGYADLPEAWLVEQEARAGKAGWHHLGRNLGRKPMDLARLHEDAGGEAPEPGGRRGLVRDGEESLEVVLVRGTPGAPRTMRRRALGIDGTAVSDPALADEVAGDSVRLPAWLTAAASELQPLTGWQADRNLARSPALVLDDEGRARVGDHHVRYDELLGLVVERRP